MLINKVAPFWTNQDRLRLAEFDKALDDILDEAHELTMEMHEAELSGDKDLLGVLLGRANSNWSDRYAAILKQRDELVFSVERRYIEHFGGDVEAILDDVREIVAATEKEEYLAKQKQRTAELKPILDAYKPGSESSKEDRNQYRIISALSVKGYVNCYFFILERINVQLNALDFYQSEDGHDLAIAIVEARAGEFYSKPKGAKLSEARRPPTVPLPIVPGAEVRGDLLTIPTGPLLSLLYDVVVGGDLDLLPERKRRYNRNQKLNVDGLDDRRRVSYTKDKTNVSIEIDDFRKVVNRNPQTKKLLIRILLRANEQAIHNGQLIRDRVSFPLRELVGEGQYKNLETARQGYHNSMGILVGLKISGKIERGKRKSIQQGGHAVLFKSSRVDNATCEVYLNEQLDWGLIAPYYTGLPDYYFALPDRAADLLEYIFFLARQNTRQLAEQGYFYITYRAIQYRLNLPDETAIRNTKRDIKDAIGAAIEQIEEKYRKYAPPIPENATGPDAIPDFALLPEEDYDAPIKQYLDEGRLKVTLKGDYARRFIELSQRTAAKIDRARKRQESIEDRAKAINLAKHTDDRK